MIHKPFKIILLLLVAVALTTSCGGGGGGGDGGATIGGGGGGGGTNGGSSGTALPDPIPVTGVIIDPAPSSWMLKVSKPAATAVRCRIPKA